MRNVFKKEIFLIIILYSVSYGLSVFNNGIFCDDWVLYNNDKNIILELFRQLGAAWAGYTHVFLLSFNKSIFLYRITVFFSYLLSALLLNNILKTIKEIDNPSRFLIVSFFALLPVNTVRIAVINAPVAWLYLSFFLGWVCVAKFISEKRLILRIAALILFFLSFTYNSILFLYIIVILYIFYKMREDSNSSQSSIYKALSFLDFYALPIVFWVIKRFYFNPYGLYEDYNRIKWDGILYGLKWSIVGFYTSFIEPVYLAFKAPSFTVIIAALIITSIIIKKYKLILRERGNDIYLFICGIIMFFAATFPYLVVGKLPQVYDLSSRFQILVPMGASFILYYGLKFLFDKLNITMIIQTFVFSTIIFLFVNSNVNSCLEYQKDWYKQLSLIENFKRSLIMKDHTSFLFKDNTLGLNAKDRVYRFYEYMGQMKYAFGDGTRFGVDSNIFNDTASYNGLLAFAFNFNMRNYKENLPEYIVTIDYGDYTVDDLKLLRLMLREIFTPVIFKENIQKIVKLTFTPIQR